MGLPHVGIRGNETMVKRVEDEGVGCSGKGSCGIQARVGISTFGKVPTMWKEGEDS